MRLGEDLNFFYGINRVNGQGSHTYTYPVPAGSYESVAVAGGSVSPAALESLRARLDQTQAILQSGNFSSIDAITREDVLGDMFQMGALGYFGQYIALSHIANNLQNAHHNLPQAYGTLGYEPNVQTFFGFPRAIHGGGIAVNVRLSRVIQPRDGDMTRWRDLNFQAGLLSSALENSVPEQMLNTPQQSVQGVSAVAALRIAADQGQRIYHITQANQAQVLPNLHLDGLAMSEITSALAVGKEVIAHTDRISVLGFAGEGYILFDPVTGDGAYKITGGANGGFTYWATVLFLALMFSLALLGGNLVGAFFIILAYKSFLDRTQKIARSNLTPEHMSAALKDAAFLAVIGALGGKALGSLGEIGAVLVWFLRGILIAFGAVWYG